MTLTLRLAKISLPLLFLIAVGGTHVLMNRNGTMDLVKATIRSKKLPNTERVLRTKWTGIKPIDDLASLFVLFFLPLFDWKHPTISMQGIHFGGQLASFWILVVIESFRNGNTAMAVSLMSFWGMYGELIGVALAIPTFCFVHLLTSPTVTGQTISFLKISEKDLRILPWSTALGHFVPLGMIMRTSASVTTPVWESKQFWLVARLFHPVFTGMIHIVLSKVLPDPVTAADERGGSGMRSLQALYGYATYVAVVPHMATMSVLILSQIGSPIFAAKYPVLFNPYKVFMPTAFWSDVPRVSTVAEGAMQFLQWDELISCSSILVWALAINREGLNQASDASGFVSMLWKTGLMFLVGGPSAAAITLVKERDFVLMDTAIGGKS